MMMFLEDDTCCYGVGLMPGTSTDEAAEHAEALGQAFRSALK
jgi:hypothetical protein